MQTRRLTNPAVLLLIVSASGCETPTANDDEPEIEYSLSLSTAGSGSGSFSLSPMTAPKYPANTQVTITAVADSSSAFTGWSGDCSGSNGICNLMMTADRNVTGTFTAWRTLTVTTVGSGTGVVTMSPTGVRHLDGSQVTLTANPAAGSTFTGWGGACTGTAATCTVTMSGDRSVSARFEVFFTLTLALAGSGSGTLTPSPAGTSQLTGSTVSITATPAPGSAFTGWRDDCANATANPCAVTMNANRTVTGVFTPDTGAGRYDGEYSGTWSGQTSSGEVLTGNPITFTVTNGVVAVTSSSLFGSGNPFSGTVSASGAVSVSATVDPTSCRTELSGQIATSLSSGITRATATGNYTLVPIPSPTACNPASGSWTLARR